MSTVLLTFADAFLAWPKKLTSTAHVNAKIFYGQLRKDFEIFTRNVDQLIPSLEKVIGRLVHLQCTQLAGQAWQTHWKKVSHDGFDIVKGKIVDYGNIEYVVVLNLITSRSPYIRKCMTWLGD